MRTYLALATLLLVPQLAAATGLSVLTVDKVAAFRAAGGLVRVGRDPELTSPPSPACPAASAVALSSYPVATQRVVTTTSVDLDCARWRRKAGGWVYDDPTASGGVSSIRYGRRGLLIRFTGIRPPGPVGYLQAWLTVGTARNDMGYAPRNTAGSLALFRDADPSNDPTVIGVGSEACVACHTR